MNTMFFTGNIFNSVANNKKYFFVIVIAVLINIGKLSAHYDPESLHWDAKYSYLPYAERFLEDGLKFLATEESTYHQPLSYLYPALFNANIGAIKISNIILSCIVVLLLYRIGTILHSRLAGAAAAIIFSLFPRFSELIPSVLTEPLFIFLMTIWFWGIAEITVNHQKRFIPIIGVSLGLAILSRPIPLYFLYLSLVIFFIGILFSRSENQLTFKHLFLAHLLAVILPAAFIVKNYLLFDYAVVSNGAGTVFFFGSHPLSNGYEPPYYGIPHDDGSVTQGIHNLSIEGNHLLKNVALLMLADRSLIDIISTYIQKTFAFVFVTNAILSDTIINERTLRIIMVVLGCVGVAAIKLHLLRWLIVAIWLYLVAIHIPLLYSHRYSVGSIDIWLIILSGVGLASLFLNDDLRKRFKPTLLIGMVIIGGIGIGEWVRNSSLELMPNVFSVPHKKLYVIDSNQLADLQLQGVIARKNNNYITVQDNAHLIIPFDAPPEPNFSLNNLVLSLHLAVEQDQYFKKCNYIHLFFKPNDESDFSNNNSRFLKVKADGKPRWYHIGVAIGPLHIASQGQLKLSIACGQGTRIALSELIVSNIEVGQYYRQKYIEKNQRLSTVSLPR